MQIIKEAETRTEYSYRRMFQGDYERYGFRCDDEGNPILKNVREERLFNNCLEKPNKFKDLGRVKRECHCFSPAIGRCECGRDVILQKSYRETQIGCKCGRIYTEDGVLISYVDDN